MKDRTVLRKCLTLHLLVLVLVMAWCVTASANEGSAAAGEDGPPQEGLETEDVYEMKASLGFGLEYNDNIDEQAHNKKTDIISHVRPAFSFKRLGGRLQADINYRGDYLFYAKDKDTEEYRHYINAVFTGEVVENLFFLSVEEDMQQVYRDVTRGGVEDDETLNDLVNRNRFTISPHFILRPSERTTLDFGYDFMDRRYSKGQDSQNPKPVSFDTDQYDFNYKKSQSHTLYLAADHELTDRATLFMGGNMTRWVDDNSENQTDQSFYRYVAYFGGAYAFSDDLSVSLKVGPSISVPDKRSSEIRPFAEANLTYTVGRSMFSAFYMTTYEDNADTGGSTQKNEYGVRWDKDFDRSRLIASLSYNEYENEVKDDSRGWGKGDTYRPYIRYTYELSNRLSCFIGYYANIYKNSEEGNTRHYGSYGFKYELSEKSTLGLSHHIKYTDVNSGDSYSTSRIMLDFTYTF